MLKMKNKNKILIFIFTIIAGVLLFHDATTSMYDGNTWGDLYKVNYERGVSVMLHKDSDMGIYTLEHDDIIMCSKNPNDGIKTFCWYLFEKNKEPIAGWIYLKNIEQIY